LHSPIYWTTSQMADLTVVYESGLLRPIEPLTFREGQRLKIRILEISSPDVSLAEALAALASANAIVETHDEFDEEPD
jgi:predicted DNA-binding antitoxin AbrB/MazE fold protein